MIQFFEQTVECVLIPLSEKEIQYIIRNAFVVRIAYAPLICMHLYLLFV